MCEAGLGDFAFAHRVKPVWPSTPPHHTGVIDVEPRPRPRGRSSRVRCRRVVVGCPADGEEDFVGFDLVAAVEGDPRPALVPPGATQFGHGHARVRDVPTPASLSPRLTYSPHELLPSWGAGPTWAGQQRHLRSQGHAMPVAISTAPLPRRPTTTKPWWELCLLSVPLPIGPRVSPRATTGLWSGKCLR